MKIGRLLYTAALSFVFFIVLGYALGYLIGRYVSEGFNDLEWQNCGSPPGKIAQIWLYGQSIYVEMNDKRIYAPWDYFYTCNFNLIEVLNKNRVEPVNWPKSQNEFWVLANNDEEFSSSKEKSSIHVEKNCIYTFQSKADPPGTVSSLIYSYCDKDRSVMHQFVLLENGQVMTWSRKTVELIPTDPVVTFPLFFSEGCGLSGFIILLFVFIFNGLSGKRKDSHN